MEFSLTEEQRIIRDSIRKFAEKEIAPTVIEREEKKEFSYELWKKMAEIQLIGLSIPMEYGGGGADALTTAIGIEAFAAGSYDMSLMMVWGSHLILCAMPIAELGTEDQKKRYLPKLASGEWIGAYGLTEPEAGSDATALKTTAEKNGDYYILNGSKTFISNAPIADVFIVFASTDLSKRAEGITVFIVEKDFPGMARGEPLKKYDLMASPTGELFFDDCKVPKENLLGEEGKGFQAMLTSLGWERMGVVASWPGFMEAELNECIKYAKQRKQYGKPIGSFQLVQAMLAEMKIDLEASRYLAYHLAWKLDRKEPIVLDAAIAKTFISEAAERSSRKAVQIFGGYGFMREYKVGRGLWNNKLACIGGGTSQIQRLIIGRLLTGLGSK
jgi:alkylation response protein AidB-like acyl-CoA dehydrogenase